MPQMRLVRSSLSPEVFVSFWRTARYGFPPHIPSRLLQAPQRMKGNEETIESLAQRVKALAESLCSPISEGDVKEQRRRKTLER